MSAQDSTIPVPPPFNPASGNNAAAKATGDPKKNNATTAAAAAATGVAGAALGAAGIYAYEKLSEEAPAENIDETTAQAEQPAPAAQHHTPAAHHTTATPPATHHTTGTTATPPANPIEQPHGGEEIPVTPTNQGGEEIPVTPTNQGGEEIPVTPTNQGGEEELLDDVVDPQILVAENPEEIAQALIAEEEVDPDDYDGVQPFEFTEIESIYDEDGNLLTGASYIDENGEAGVLMDIDGDGVFDVAQTDQGYLLTFEDPEQFLTVDDAQLDVTEGYLAYDENLDPMVDDDPMDDIIDTTELA